MSDDVYILLTLVHNSIGDSQLLSVALKTDINRFPGDFYHYPMEYRHIITPLLPDELSNCRIVKINFLDYFIET